MRYCESCGTPHECAAEGAAERAEVAIERLRTQRDIEVARIQASAAKVIAETEAEHSAEHAEGVAEGMESALDAVAGNSGEPEGEPIVVDTTDVDDEPEPEPGPDSEPPYVDVPTPASRKPSGWWSAYR